MSLEALEEMKYFEAFLIECLRFYSPVARVMRQGMYDETYKDLVFPAGTKYLIPIRMLHRHEKYWSKPLEFQPERWLGKEVPYSHPFAYLPFSHGPRNCVGYKFAEIEARLIMSNLIRAFEFRLAPSLRDSKFELTGGITPKLNPVVKVSAKPQA